jgi:hypothetical protein
MPDELPLEDDGEEGEAQGSLALQDDDDTAIADAEDGDGVAASGANRESKGDAADTGESDAGTGSTAAAEDGDFDDMAPQHD